MESTRQKKIGRLLLKDMSEMFQKEAKELTIGAMVSVTVVRVSPDLGSAKIYLSIFPSDKANEVFTNINEWASRLRFLLGQRIGKQMRVVPELHFYLDDSLDYIDNIDRLLNE
jgi:ribosome-binding factor A